MSWRKRRPNPYVPQPYLSLPGYKPIKQVAHEQGLSEKRILQLILQKRIPAMKFGGRYLIPEHAPIERKPHGRTRTRPRQWNRYVAGATVYTQIIEVWARPGKSDELSGRLTGLSLDQHFLFAGTMQRYILLKHGDPDQLILILIWKDTDLADETSLARELEGFCEAFDDVLDWTTSTMHRARALAYT